MSAIQRGVRRKWQTTVEARPQPPDATTDGDCCDAEAWSEQWRALWPETPGGDDFDSLVVPMDRHDREIAASGELLLESLDTLLVGVPVVTRESAKAATRKRFELVRLLSAKFARTLAKRVREERQVTPSEFAAQRNFLIQEHEKRLAVMSSEASNKAERLTQAMDAERRQMQERLDRELAAADRRHQQDKRLLEEAIRGDCEEQVRAAQEQLAAAMKRLANGDCKSSAELNSQKLAVHELEEQSKQLQRKIELGDKQAAEREKEIEKLQADCVLAKEERDKAMVQSRMDKDALDKTLQREKALEQDLAQVRKDLGILNEKLSKIGRDLEMQEKHSADVEQRLHAAEVQLPQIEILKAELASEKKNTLHQLRLKQQTLRRACVLEDEITSFQKDHKMLLSQIDKLRAMTSSHREAQVMADFLLQGIEEETQRRLFEAGEAGALKACRQLLALRARELREEALLPTHLLEKASLSLSSDGNSDSEETIRNRLLFRASALEIELERLHANNPPAEVKLVNTAQEAMERMQGECGEEKGAMLPLKVVPYNFHGDRGIVRRDVNDIVSELYQFETEKATPADSGERPQGAAASSARPASAMGRSDNGRTTVSADASTAAIARAGPTASHISEGGMPVLLPSSVYKIRARDRQKSALKSRKRPEPMSLGVTSRGGPTKRPSSAQVNGSSERSFVAEDLIKGVMRGRASASRTTKGMLMKGRPSSALARMSLEFDMKVVDQPRQIREQDLVRSRDGEDAADSEIKAHASSGMSIYQLMRHQTDPMSTKRQEQVRRFLDRAHHDFVILQPKVSRVGGTAEGMLDFLRLTGVPPAAPNFSAQSERELDSARARAAGRRPRALSRFETTTSCN